MKKAFAIILSAAFLVMLFGCAGKKTEESTEPVITKETTSVSETAGIATETTESEKITTEETTTVEVTTVTEEVTTTEETTTTEEETTTEEPVVDPKQIEQQLCRLWKVAKSDDPTMNCSASNFLFESGVIYGGSKDEFRHEFKSCGRYEIAENGEITCSFFSLATGVTSVAVFVPTFDDTGESMLMYCKEISGYSFFGGKENQSDYTLTFELTNYPSESKSNDAKLKGAWISNGASGVMMLNFSYDNNFKFEMRLGQEIITGTWKGYGGTVYLKYSDGTSVECKYQVDKNAQRLILIIDNIQYNMVKNLPIY